MRSAPSWRRSSGSRVRGRRQRAGRGQVRDGGPARARVLWTAGGLCALLLAGLLGACAVVEAPPGGPVDMTAPRLAAASPESGSVALGEVRRLRFTFTEKMTRQPAEGWLHFYPAQRIRHTSWHGAREAEVELWEPLPADTVVVAEIAATMQDAHKVKAKESRRFPLATAAAIPAGRLAGALVMGDSAVGNGVVELYPLQPDSLEYFQRPLLRRAVTDHLGRWSFEWLPVPGGPWLVRAFADPDRNLRAGDREAQRLLPDTLSLADGGAERQLGALTLYPWDAPGRLQVPAFDRRGWNGGWFAWPTVIAAADTGWAPTAAAHGARSFALDPGAGSTLEKVPSGALRVVVFADIDGDSLLSRVPADSLRHRGAAVPWPDTLSAAMYLEPWWLVENLTLPPGLEARLVVPGGPPTLTAVAAADTAGTAASVAKPIPKERR